MLLNQSQVQLPAPNKRQTLEAETGAKGKSFSSNAEVFLCHLPVLGEELNSKAIYMAF